MHLPREALEAGDVGDARNREAARRHDQEGRGDARAVVGGDRPAIAGFVEHRLDDARAEQEVAAQVEAIGDVLEVAQDLGLGGVALRPRPLLLELARPRVGVRHALDVAAGAGVAIPEPRPADAARLVDHEGGEADLAQPVQEIAARRCRRRR